MCKAAYADFSPGEPFKEEWIGKRQPFRGADKKEFGFQITLKVSAVENGEAVNEKKPEQATKAEYQDVDGKKVMEIKEASGDDKLLEAADEPQQLPDIEEEEPREAKAAEPKEEFKDGTLVEINVEVKTEKPTDPKEKPSEGKVIRIP